MGIIPIGIACFILIISLTQNVIYAFVALFSSIILAIFNKKFTPKYFIIAVIVYITAFFVTPIIIGNINAAAKKERLQAIADAKTACRDKGYSWNYSRDACNTDEEQVEHDTKQTEHQNSKPTSSTTNNTNASSTVTSSNHTNTSTTTSDNHTNTDTNTITPNSNSNQPAISTIADACWQYGQTHSVPLTDYASTSIKTESDGYYQIVMYHRDGSLWKCWYHPTSKNVMIEKIYN